MSLFIARFNRSDLRIIDKDDDVLPVEVKFSRGFPFNTSIIEWMGYNASGSTPAKLSK
ncbi:MAG: hypothetical protein JXR86_14970 [Spirochaetales bacterium]|nr:hypothetical protein [Spirochaetales bacterium]